VADTGFLTTAEVAERYRTSPSTIRYWRMTGYLRAGTQYGRRTLYDPAELDEFDRQRRADDAAERDPQPAA
jgi:DNA-binding transcriptional MerR regulator